MVPVMTEPQATTIVCRTFNPEGDERGRSVTVQILDDHVVVLGEDASGITLTAQQANTMSRSLAGFSALLEPGTTPAMAQQEEVTYQELLESVESEKNERLRRELAEARLAKVQAERDEYAAALDFERRYHKVTKDALTRVTAERYELAGGELAHATLRRVTRERDAARAELETARTENVTARKELEQMKNGNASAWRWHGAAVKGYDELYEQLAKVTAEHDDARRTLAQCSAALVDAREEADEARRANDALHAQRDIDLAEIAIAREDLEQAEAERDTARAASERVRAERDACFAQLASMHASHAIVLECWSVTARSLDAANEVCQQAESELRAARADAQRPAPVNIKPGLSESGTTDLRGPWAMVGRVSGDANHGDGEPVAAELSEVIVRLVNGSTTSAPVAWAGTPPINLAIGYPFVGMEDRAAAVVTLGGIMLQPDNARALGRYLTKAADHVAPAAPTIGDIVHERVDRFIDDARSLPLGETAELRATLGRGTPGPDGSPRMWASFDLVAHELSGDCHLIGAAKGGE